MSVLLEVCVDTTEGFFAAMEGGADRIELCSALDVGGLTPSRGVMAFAGETHIPTYAMIRPRAGGFVFDNADRDVMLRDIDAARDSGLAGVVLGASRPDGRLDVEMLAALSARAGAMGRTLHRAFDLVPDPAEALEQAVALGFERILTSGLALTAPDGAAVLRHLVEQAGGRIAIMAGSGIGPANVETIARETGIREVHASCRSPVTCVDETIVRFGFASPERRQTSRAVVRQMRDALGRMARS